jgi:protein SCO1/2
MTPRALLFGLIAITLSTASLLLLWPRATNAGAGYAPPADVTLPVDSTPPAEELAGRLGLPDVELSDQRGEPVRLQQLARGRVVVIGFIYTSCTTICPPIGASLSRLQQEEAARLGRELAILTITLDPLHDTPERLAAWGRRFGAKERWTLLGGKKESIDRVLKALGVYTAAKETHAPLVLVGDADRGRWTRMHALSAPGRLAHEVEKMIAARSN